MRHRIFLIAVMGIFLAFAKVTCCDSVVMRNGKILLIETYRVEKDRLILLLEGGGEVVCPVSSILRIEKDWNPAEEEKTPFIFAETFERVDQNLRHLIENTAKRYEIDVRLVAAIISVESNFNASAVSPRGAKGLMQLMPETASRYDVRNIFDPAENIEGGVRHLKSLMSLYRDDLDMVLAAYNAGEKAVERYNGIPPFQETRDYVDRVMDLYQTLSMN